jgi:hypothetical protein
MWVSNGKAGGDVMERTRVNSSSIASVGYDPRSAVMEIEFRDGGVYQYFLVPRQAYEGLLAADSKGAYINRNIKGAGYPYSKVA